MKPHDFSAPTEVADEEALWLFGESGIYRPGMNGPERLSWSEIDAWSRMAGHDLRPEDADLIASMSSAFCGGYHAEKAPHEPLACQIALASAEMSSF